MKTQDSEKCLYIRIVQRFPNKNNRFEAMMRRSLALTSQVSMRKVAPNAVLVVAFVSPLINIFFLSIYDYCLATHGRWARLCLVVNEK